MFRVRKNFQKCHGGIRHATQNCIVNQFERMYCKSFRISYQKISFRKIIGDPRREGWNLETRIRSRKAELYKVSIHSGFTSQKCPVIQIIFKYYTYLTECTGAAASTLPLILSTSISDVCAKSFGKPWYSSMMGSNTSANTS